MNDCVAVVSKCVGAFLAYGDLYTTNARFKCGSRSCSSSKDLSYNALVADASCTVYGSGRDIFVEVFPHDPCVLDTFEGIFHINVVVDGDEHEDVREENCVLVTGTNTVGDCSFALQNDDTVRWWAVLRIAV